MKRRLSVIPVLYFSIFVLGCPNQQVQEPDVKIVKWVVDEAEIISDDDELLLNELLSSHYEKSTVQIVCVVPASLNNIPIRDYARNHANSWGVGTAGVNNGVLITIAPNERQWSIEIGSGLEWQITDSISGVIGQKMVSFLKEGDIFNSFKTACEQIIELSNLVSWSLEYEAISELVDAPVEAAGQIVTFTAIINENSQDHYQVSAEGTHDVTVLKTKYSDSAWPNVQTGKEYRFFARINSITPLVLQILGLESLGK